MQDTEHHTLVLSVQQFQGQQMIKVLCLPSQEIISLSASPYLSLTAKES